MKFAPLISLVLLMIFFSLGTPYFLNFNNLLTVALQTSVIGIIAIGMTYVIITSGIDLSVGSVMAFSGVAVGLAASIGLPLPICIIIGALAGAFCGAINGALITRITIPPFIATLGLMMSIRGINLVLTDGRALYFTEYPTFKL
ncbi:ribose ABC transport system permease protein RbsC [Vibrio variabilis]|uniref:Ribose ABC transport system permease protein RbsC n=1 Tax=Vibrio variabilis TaxID=990271 RepID=A0ABQ0JHE6_9VIBR|nr:ribose ABC transport system permease protein RbsC [Vibrio variabilis]